MQRSRLIGMILGKVCGMTGVSLTILPTNGVAGGSFAEFIGRDVRQIWRVLAPFSRWFSIQIETAREVARE